MIDPRCIFCGARLIQKLGKLRVMPSEITQRRRAVLADWIAAGHRESEIRELVALPVMAVAPVVKG